MADSTDTGAPSVKLEARSEPSPTDTTSTTGLAIAATPGVDDSASSITVNTKAPPSAANNNFPPPKTDKPRPHVCQTCQRSFARLEHLKRHERSHTKEKPFECPECTRCFARRDLLLRHQQKLHQTTTPSSRPRNRRESTSGAVPPGSRARKNSIANSSVSGVLAGGAGQMRPRANTISHVDGAAMSMIAAANASVARSMGPAHPHQHSRHPSLVGLSMHGHGHTHGHGHGLGLDHHPFAGMASAMGQRGMPHPLPKLETHGLHSFDPFSGGLRTAPPVAAYEFDFEGLLFGPGTTINPNALHYSDSPQSMALDPTSPFSHGMQDLTPAHHIDDGFDWLTGFEQQMSFNNNPPEHAVDGSSPSAISTTSQSGISDVMLDGSMMDGSAAHHTAVTTSMASSTFFPPSVMGPPQMTNPFGLDLTGTVFPDLLSGGPVSPQPPTPQSLHQQQQHHQHQQQQQQHHQQQTQQHRGSTVDSFFSTPPPSLSSLSPTMLSGLGNNPNLNHALTYTGAGPETPSSMNGINIHGTSPVSSITDSTRSAILGALSCAAPQYPFGGRKYSFGASSNSSGLLTAGAGAASATSPEQQLPSTQDLQRYVSAYLRHFHPHLPFLHAPTLSFDMPATSAGGGLSGSGGIGNSHGSGGNAVGGSGCLVLSMAAIGALYELEHERSGQLFEMAKKMIQLYLDERRKANVRKADFRRLPMGEPGGGGQSADNTVETPVWLVQAMLLNVVYGHNCGEKRAGEIASTHAAALVSLAQGAELLRPVRIEPRSSSNNISQQMEGVETSWNGSSGGGDKPSATTAAEASAEDQAEWLRWAAMEERKRTLYVIFILSSMLVTAYNQTPALTNSEILLDLPCDEDFFSAESAAAFRAKGGVGAANHNRQTFHDALAVLLQAHTKPQFRAAAAAVTAVGVNAPHQSSFGAAVSTTPGAAIPPSDLRVSAMGCLILINALHNYIWETRQRHHNKVWTNEETEKLHRHLEPALRAWQAAWAADPQHSLERPNPFGAGPLSADAVPLMDLAYVRLFVNMSRTKEKFWQRDWDGLADELARGSEIVQHAEHYSPASNAESSSLSSAAGTDPLSLSLSLSEGTCASGCGGGGGGGGGGGSISSSVVFGDSPPTQSSSPEFAAAKFPPTSTNAAAAADGGGSGSGLGLGFGLGGGGGGQQAQLGGSASAVGLGGGNSNTSTTTMTTAARAMLSRREKHLRKAAFYAADSLAFADRLGVSFADLTSRELPLQSAMCAFDCSQVLAEWVATLQDRVGRYLGVLGQDDLDLTQVPAIVLLEEEDVRLLGKVQELLGAAEAKMSGGTEASSSAGNAEDGGGGVTAAATGGGGRGGGRHAGGYASKILRLTALRLSKAAVWPVTHLMATCLEHHAGHMRARAEKSVLGCD